MDKPPPSEAPEAESIWGRKNLIGPEASKGGGKHLSE